uniref:Uncharacterized protein n=1 Tax=Anopheles farauti TaxID=69004 RepID=A0A182Q016_9DIPT
MEYASFVKDLRETPSNCSRFSPDTEYAKEFEQHMQALVINFDIDEEKLSEQCHPCSAPTASQIGLKQPMHGSATFGRLHNRPLAPDDELDHGAACKRKKTIQFDQKYDGQESISSNESSEDSLLEPTVVLTIEKQELPIERSPVLSVSMKRTYDEANS